MLLDDAEGKQTHALGLVNRSDEIRASQLLPVDGKVVLGDGREAGGQEGCSKAEQNARRGHRHELDSDWIGNRTPA
jgi:hypothetical protein